MALDKIMRLRMSVIDLDRLHEAARAESVSPTDLVRIALAVYLQARSSALSKKKSFSEIVAHRSKQEILEDSKAACVELNKAVKAGANDDELFEIAVKIRRISPNMSHLERHAAYWARARQAAKNHPCDDTAQDLLNKQVPFHHYRDMVRQFELAKATQPSPVAPTLNAPAPKSEDDSDSMDDLLSGVEIAEEA